MAAVSEFMRDALLGLLILLAVAQRQRDPRPAAGRLAVGAGARDGAARGARGSPLADVAPRLRTWEGLLLVLLIVIVAANAISRAGLPAAAEPGQPAHARIEKAIVALAMAFVIISGEIDLSVASIMGLAAILFAWAIDQGVAPEIAVAARAAGSASCAASSTASGSRSSVCRRSR